MWSLCSLDGSVANTVHDNIKNPSHYTQGKIEAKTFIVDQESAFEHLVFSASRDCLDNDSWQYRRGKMDTLSQLINFEEMIRNNYNNLEKDSEIDAQWQEVVH